MQMRSCVALVAIAGLLCTGCMSMPAGVASSTKPLAPGGYTELGPATGDAFGLIVFGIPLSEPNPAKQSVDRAIANGGGDALINVTLDVMQIQLFVAVLVWTTTNGTGVKTK